MTSREAPCQLAELHREDPATGVAGVRPARRTRAPRPITPIRKATISTVLATMQTDADYVLASLLFVTSGAGRKGKESTALSSPR